MRGVGIVVAVAAFAGCGRVGFDGLTSTDGGDAGTDRVDGSGLAIAPDHVALALTSTLLPSVTASVVTESTQVGDFLVVQIGWGTAAGLLPILTDSFNTAFTILPHADTRPGNFRTHTAYGFVTEAGTDTVTVNLGGTADNFLQLRVLTFRDVDPAQPFDDSCGAADATAGPDAIRCDVTTTRDNDMLIIYSLVDGGQSLHGSNTMDVTTDQGDATSIAVAGPAGPYEITQFSSQGEWVSNGLAIRGRLDL